MDLHGLLQNAMRNAGGVQKQTPCDDTFGPGVTGCWASQHEGAVRRLLVWVSDSACSPPPFPIAAVGWDQIITLLPQGTPAGRLPAIAAPHVAAWYAPGRVNEKVADVLNAASIYTDAFRLFISYRHDDCAVFAGQLFDSLSHASFDVYLDRFRTPPGADFIERIRYELADKTCVILLDTADVVASDWVSGEYAFARRYRLGLMAIDLPGGSQTYDAIRRRLDFRSRASAADFQLHGLAGDVDDAVDFVRRHYFSEVGRRLRYQRRIVQSTAAAAGVHVAPRGDGMFDAWGPNGLKYVVGASARPPGAEAFRRAHEAAAPLGRKAVVVGPLQAQLRAGRQNAEWLARTSRSAIVDERRLYKAMRHIGSGTL